MFLNPNVWHINVGYITLHTFVTFEIFFLFLKYVLKNLVKPLLVENTKEILHMGTYVHYSIVYNYEKWKQPK